MLVETDALVLEFHGDTGMTIDPVAGGKGKKRTDAQNHGTEYFIADVEVVVGVTRPTALDDAITRIFGGILRQVGAKMGARFHGFEDEVDAKTFVTLQGQEIGAGAVFLPEAFLLHRGIGPRNGNAMITGVGFDPIGGVLRPRPQRLLGKGVDAVHVAEEIDNGLRTGEQGEIALDDDTVETVV